MVYLDLHSTDLSVSDEEGHSTILLAHYIFGLKLRTKLFSNTDYAAKLHKNAYNLTFVVQFAYFSIRPKEVFAFSSNF